MHLSGVAVKTRHIPFAEAELRMDDDTEIESVDILDEILPMEADETL